MSALPAPRSVVGALPLYSRATTVGISCRASSNESPVSASPRAVLAAAEATLGAHLYPDMGGESLIEALAAHLDVHEGRVAVGAGSLALLERLLLAYTGPGDEVVHAWRSYEAYPISIAVAGATAVPVPLDAAHVHDPAGLLAAITDRTRMLIVCNPNNPTGTTLGHDELTRLIGAVPRHVLVVLDEAYREFDPEPPDSRALLEAHPNLVLLRTFSKAYALAGLRVGYLVASSEIVAAVRRVSMPFSVNRVAAAGAIAALADAEHLARVVSTVARSRERLQEQARGLDLPVSRTNFQWFPDGPLAARVHDDCLAVGISVRAFPGEGVRVSLGAPEVDRSLGETLTRWLSEAPIGTPAGLSG